VTVSRTVVPGDWYGVLGDRVIVLLPPAAKARVAGLWETVDEGAGFDEVLDALISDGLRGLPSFVLVSGEGHDVKVVIRGPGEAELDTANGPVTVSGSADTTWVEQNVSGVSALRVRVADGEGAPYTVGSGLVRVASVQHPATAASERAAEPEAEPLAEPVSEPVAAAVAVPVEPPAPVGPPEPSEHRARILPPDPQLEQERAAEAAAAEAAAGAAAPALPTEPLVATPPVAPIPGAPVPIPVSGPPGGVPFDPLTSPDLAVRPGDPPPPDHRDDTGDTQAGGFDTGQVADEAPAAPTTRPVARLIFSSGEVVDVDRAVVIGRAPDHGRFDEEQTRLVTVPSPHQEISSTHLEIRPGTGADHGSAVATDLGSTNGTVVAQPGLPAEDLRPGIAVQLSPGATIDLGEGVTIQVTRA
jgi:hypothetical protein